MRMPLAFIGTCQANLGAQFTDLLGHLAVASHGWRGKTGDCYTVSVKHDSASHQLRIAFVEASSEARIASDSTSVAFINAGEICVG